MKEEIQRTIQKLEDMKWITVNNDLNREALATVFVDILKEMSVKKFLTIFSFDN
jgi:hypothetical protein